MREAYIDDVNIRINAVAPFVALLVLSWWNVGQKYNALIAPTARELEPKECYRSNLSAAFFFDNFLFLTSRD